MNFVVTQIAISVLLSNAAIRCRLYGYSGLWENEDKVVFLVLFLMYQFNLFELLPSKFFAIIFIPIFSLITGYKRKFNLEILYVAFFSLIMFIVGLLYPAVFFYSFLTLFFLYILVLLKSTCEILQIKEKTS